MLGARANSSSPLEGRSHFVLGEICFCCEMSKTGTLAFALSRMHYSGSHILVDFGVIALRRLYYQAISLEFSFVMCKQSSKIKLGIEALIMHWLKGQNDNSYNLFTI
jgi:hypothetical protein